jgi:plastocyanin
MASEKIHRPVDAGRRRFLTGLVSGGGVAVAVMAITMHPAAEAAGLVEVSMKIITGRMIGKPGWPKYEPANLVLPPHRLVQVTVRDYDDGSADIPGGYNRVKGTVGGVMRVIKGTPATIAPQTGTVVKEIPVKDVAHTFTMIGEDFFMNVPMPVLSTVVYRFMTPGPGTYSWQCMAACGTGAGGWGGSMATDGWMRGVVTVK